MPALTNNLDEIYLSKLEDYDFKNKLKHRPNNLSRVTTGAHATERVKIINKASLRSQKGTSGAPTVSTRDYPTREGATAHDSTR